MITLNGRTSDSLGIIIDGYSSKPIASRRVQTKQIPGRNGDLVIDEGVYDNYTQSYTLYWLPTTPNEKVAEWLQQSGYVKLIDSDIPGYFRLARVKGPIVPINHSDCYTEAVITFDCKPQWFLNSGDVWVNHILTAPDVEVQLENPTSEMALPLLYVSKQNASDDVSVLVNGDTFELIPYKDATKYYIDSDLKEVYYGAYNRNNAFAGDFPVLQSGTNTLTMRGSLGENAYVSIKPRWWTS